MEQGYGKDAEIEGSIEELKSAHPVVQGRILKAGNDELPETAESREPICVLRVPQVGPVDAHELAKLRIISRSNIEDAIYASLLKNRSINGLTVRECLDKLRADPSCKKEDMLKIQTVALEGAETFRSRGFILDGPHVASMNGIAEDALRLSKTLPSADSRTFEIEGTTIRNNQFRVLTDEEIREERKVQYNRISHPSTVATLDLAPFGVKFASTVSFEINRSNGYSLTIPVSNSEVGDKVVAKLIEQIENKNGYWDELVQVYSLGEGADQSITLKFHNGYMCSELLSELSEAKALQFSFGNETPAFERERRESVRKKVLEDGKSLSTEKLKSNEPKIVFEGCLEYLFSVLEIAESVPFSQPKQGDLETSWEQLRKRISNEEIAELTRPIEAMQRVGTSAGSWVEPIKLAKLLLAMGTEYSRKEYIKIALRCMNAGYASEYFKKISGGYLHSELRWRLIHRLVEAPDQEIFRDLQPFLASWDSRGGGQDFTNHLTFHLDQQVRGLCKTTEAGAATSGALGAHHQKVDSPYVIAFSHQLPEEVMNAGLRSTARTLNNGPECERLERGIADDPSVTQYYTRRIDDHICGNPSNLLIPNPLVDCYWALSKLGNDQRAIQVLHTRSSPQSYHELPIIVAKCSSNNAFAVEGRWTQLEVGMFIGGKPTEEIEAFFSICNQYGYSGCLRHERDPENNTWKVSEVTFDQYMEEVEVWMKGLPRID